MPPRIPDLEYTAVDDIPSIAGRLRSTFYTHKTRPLEFRLVQLRKLYWAYATHSKASMRMAN